MPRGDFGNLRSHRPSTQSPSRLSESPQSLGMSPVPPFSKAYGLFSSRPSWPAEDTIDEQEAERLRYTRCNRGLEYEECMAEALQRSIEALQQKHAAAHAAREQQLAWHEEQERITESLTKCFDADAVPSTDEDEEDLLAWCPSSPDLDDFVAFDATLHGVS